MWKKLSNHNTISMLHAGSAMLLAMILVIGSFVTSVATSADGSPNSPPNTPSNPFPVNRSTKVSITAHLNWTGGDPDNDTVTYNVLFGTNQTPAQVATNISTTFYNPGTLNFSTTYFWRIIAWDNHSQSTSGPLWEFTTRTNHPPKTPSTPDPGNGSTEVLITTDLSWTGGDPDNDTVKYDLYFGQTITPPIKASNLTDTIYNSLGTLLDNTLYYWRIIATDNHSASTSGPLWRFTTGTSSVNVTITKPLNHMLYVNDVGHKFIGPTIVFGAITITANATSDAGIKNVTFSIDGTPVKNFTTGPYSYPWDANVKGLRHTIKVVAYDNNGKNGSAEINIIKWKLHLIPLLIVGAVVVTLLIPHTTIKGLVLNLRQNGMRGYTFFALRMHFHTVSLIKNIRGVIKMKRVVIRFAIPPTMILKLGPPRTLAYFSGTFLGSSMSTLTHPASGIPQGLLPLQGGKKASHGLFSSFMKSMMSGKT
jgi:hypothetical protein